MLKWKSQLASAVDYLNILWDMCHYSVKKKKKKKAVTKEQQHQLVLMLIPKSLQIRKLWSSLQFTEPTMIIHTSQYSGFEISTHHNLGKHM